MVRFSTAAAAIVLMIGQPVTAAWAQSDNGHGTVESSRRRDDGAAPFFSGPPERIIVALGALTAVVLGLTAAFKKHNHGNSGPRPTSP